MVGVNKCISKHWKGLFLFLAFASLMIATLPWLFSLQVFDRERPPSTMVLAQETTSSCLQVNEGFDAVDTAHDIIARDFNEDGHLDLAILAHLPILPPKGLVIMVGDGTGRFSYFELLPVGDHNHGLISTDLNNDGHLDLAITTADRINAQYEQNLVHTYLGNGQGRFPSHSLWPVEQSRLGPLDVEAADLNMDGNKDLIVAGAGLGHVVVLLGDGTGQFGPPTFFSNKFNRTRSTVIADFNGDGNLDVIASNRFGKTVSLLLGDGRGGLEYSEDFSTGVGPRTLVTADLNGDGHLDIAVTTRESDGISVLFGNGRGGFSRSLNIKTGRDPRTIRSGDFNNDRFLDLVVSNSLSQEVTLLFGDGRGGFSKAPNIPIGDGPTRGRIGSLPSAGEGAGLVGLDTADLNQDGRVDILVSSTFDGRVYILSNLCAHE